MRAQTRRALEVIVVDDASSDDSASVAERAGARVIRLEKNGGNAVARNAGVRASSGDAIAMLDSDDFWEPNHLELVGGLLDKYPEAAAAGATVRYVGKRSGTWQSRAPVTGPGYVLKKAFWDWLTPMQTAMVRRDAFDAIGGFDESLRVAVDFDLWLRLARDHLFVSTREVTANWRWHDKQLSTHPDEQYRTTYLLRRRMLDRIASDGDLTLAAELAELFRLRWSEDLQSAWDEGRMSWLRQLVELSAVVPDAPRALRWKWAVRSRIPSQVRPVLRSVRAAVAE